LRGSIHVDRVTLVRKCRVVAFLTLAKTDLTDLSVDHLVGADEERAGYFDPERLRCL
jgi:hypothetical protein